LNRTPGPNLGNITLVGAGVATGGLLNGVVCDMTISGRFAQPCPI
jgi:hypothetical protein